MSQVAILRASYETALSDMRALLAPLGGMEAFVKPGQKVLLKANLLGSYSVEKAVTTNPAVVEAAIILVKEAGGIPMVGDSPGMGTMRQAVKAGGLEEILKREGAILADFEQEDEYPRPENKISQRLMLARAVKEADVIITLPKLKTHVQMNFTGAIKNQYGLMVGVRKSNYHLRLRDNWLMGQLMVEINKTAKVSLAIMDAVTAMEGDGPSGGSPRHLGLLLASNDLLAVDLAACRIIGLDPMTVPTNVAAIKDGYGESEEKLSFPLLKPEEVKVDDFKQISHVKDIIRMLPMPKWFMRWFGAQWAPTPRIDPTKCIRCFRCRSGCPVKPPAIDPERGVKVSKDCIRCYCCHEFCPADAIKLKRSLLDRVFHFSALLNFLSRVFGKFISKFSI